MPKKKEYFDEIFIDYLIEYYESNIDLEATARYREFQKELKELMQRGQGR